MTIENNKSTLSIRAFNPFRACRGTIVSAAVAGLLALGFAAPAAAADASGHVVAIKTCEDSGTRRILMQLDNDDWYYIGWERSSSNGFAAHRRIALAALLAGKKVQVDHNGGAGSYCGTNVVGSAAHNGHSITIAR